MLAVWSGNKLQFFILLFVFFFFNDTATTEIYTLSLHDALPISGPACRPGRKTRTPQEDATGANPADSLVAQVPSDGRAGRSGRRHGGQQRGRTLGHLGGSGDHLRRRVLGASQQAR